MSGSRLGRGRGGRLAVYGGCGVVVVLLVFLYRAATSEMARLRELHVQCAHQQEALAAHLQVIIEYKKRLESSLVEEKKTNAAVKQELQQRASLEKSLRDKDSMEAMQRFSSLQQSYKLLQTEHQDLQEDCKKREKQASEDTTRLEETLQELRTQVKQAREEKERSLENLKTKNLELDTEKTKLEDKYKELLKSNGNTDSVINHLKKEVFQLKRELEEAKKSSVKLTSPGPSLSSPQSSSVQRPSQQQQPQQQQQQSSASTSSMKPMAAARSESSTTSSSGNPVSTASEKPLPVVRSASKLKLPAGVVAVPVLLNQKPEVTDEKAAEQPKKKEEPVQSVKNSKEHEQAVESVDLDQQFPALQRLRKMDDKALGRHGNAGWIRVRPGVQEIGDELNQLGNFHGLDDTGDRHEAEDEQYDDFDKDPVKNGDLHLAEGEDEGEDEDDHLET